jgi:hypothetical protein
VRTSNTLPPFECLQNVKVPHRYDLGDKMKKLRKAKVGARENATQPSHLAMCRCSIGDEVLLNLRKQWRLEGSSGYQLEQYTKASKGSLTR